jgi:protein-S-isoprenylcysteine O-methyltransferase Ste14
LIVGLLILLKSVSLQLTEVSLLIKPTLGTYLSFFEKYVLPLVFLSQAYTALANFSEIKSGNLIVLLDDILKPILFSVLLFISAKSTRVLNLRVFIGVILSYGSLYFLDPVNSKHSSTINSFFYLSLVFYLILSIYSLSTLGRSFTVFPARFAIVAKGPYSVLRHPIYSSYLHFFCIFVLINLNLLNICLILLFFIGILLRSVEEEKILSVDDIYKNDLNSKPRFLKLQITLPVYILAFLLLQEAYSSRKIISVNISYPIYSLQPHKADDWSSFFVMNHIYPRLLTKKGYFRSQGILENKRINCADNDYSILSSQCKRVQVKFKLRSKLQGCSGRSYSNEIFKKELEAIASSKNWLLPNFSWCKGMENCFEFENKDNIQNRLESIYLRFGWSLSNKNENYGIFPNCFKVSLNSNELITDGTITTPNSKIDISTSSKDADVYLYENSKTKGVYSQISYYNPIYYFLVINGKLNTLNLLNNDLLDTITKVFTSEGIFTSKNNSDILFTDYNPHLINKKSPPPSTHIQIALPDYLEKCKSIELALNNKLLDSSVRKIFFKCLNITEYVEMNVKNSGHWTAFISPLTPGLPGKEALGIQYFDINSSDSWLGKEAPQKTQVHFLGMSKGKLQLRRGKYCYIKPNSLGLSDFTVDDIKECEI